MNYQAAIAMLQDYEGNVRHMYLDTRGYVTVGVGQLLATATDATRFAFYLTSAKVKPLHRAATTGEITTEYGVVAALPKGNSPAFYGKSTTMEMTQADIDPLLLTRIQGFEYLTFKSPSLPGAAWISES